MNSCDTLTWVSFRIWLDSVVDENQCLFHFSQFPEHTSTSQRLYLLVKQNQESGRQWEIYWLLLLVKSNWLNLLIKSIRKIYWANSSRGKMEGRQRKAIWIQLWRHLLWVLVQKNNSEWSDLIKEQSCWCCKKRSCPAKSHEIAKICF